MNNSTFNKIINFCKNNNIQLFNETIPIKKLDYNYDYIGNVNIHLTNHCDINCAMCDHFAPVYDEWYEDVNNYEKLLKRLSELFSNKIKQISLMGGEPLLHSNLIEFWRITRQYFSNCHLMIKTNGLILSNKEEDFYINIKKYNPIIIISKYDINININTDKIKEMCYKHNIVINIRDRSYFMHTNLLNTRNHNIEDEYYNCVYSQILNNKITNYSCIQLNTNGDFYFCSLPANISAINKYFDLNFEVIKDDDYVNIYKVNGPNIIIDKMKRPISFCKYCNNKEREENINWSLSNRQLKEWIR